MEEVENKNSPDRHIRSYVLRTGRITPAQTRALSELGPAFILELHPGALIDPEASFGRKAPLVLEIGFGMGQSFIRMAAADPNSNYLGIEVHPPGVGATLLKIQELKLNNVRIIRADAYEVLQQYLPAQSTDIVQIFFPDPWPKKRHHKRRLINAEFLKMLAKILKPGGQLRLATDWEDYALQMLELLTAAAEFENLAPNGGFFPRPEWRPVTKFEKRGERLGHGVWDLLFERRREH